LESEPSLRSGRFCTNAALAVVKLAGRMADKIHFERSSYRGMLIEHLLAGGLGVARELEQIGRDLLRLKLKECLLISQ
jgi:hypothetical protein